MLGVTIGERHSYDYWKMLLKERPKIGSPAVKTVYQEIPGGSSFLDLTEVLTGRPEYESRTIHLSFIIMAPRIDWPWIYSDLMNYIHGQRRKVILDEDPGYYYIGRLTVNQLENEKKTGLITIDGEMEAYKYAVVSTGEDWLWDPFSFENGLIQDYKDMQVDGTLEITLVGNQRAVMPAFFVSSDMRMEFQGKQYVLTKGENHIPDIQVQGTQVIKIIGSGTITIDYREESL